MHKCESPKKLFLFAFYTILKSDIPVFPINAGVNNTDVESKPINEL